MLDSFENHRVIPARHPAWSAWMWVRYAEVLVAYYGAVLATNVAMPISPEKLVAPERPVGFGVMLDLARRFSRKQSGADPWSTHIAALVLDHANELERIRCDRNDIAHGRSFRTTQQIRGDIEACIQPNSWRTAVSELGKPPSSALEPWIHPQDSFWFLSENEPAYGVFEQWNAASRSYVVPATGKRFDVARPQSDFVR